MEDNRTNSQPLIQASKKPNGARFYRCALQINPFVYLERYSKQSTFNNEAAYNAAIIKSCKKNKIEAIAVTDHYRVSDSQNLVAAAREAGIFVFGGFEAASKDGVHFLCLYDPNKDDSLERFIGEFGVYDHNVLSPTGNKDCLELLKCVRDQGGVAIAAHVAADNGLLVTLEGQPRINAWGSSDLYACALPGPVDDSPQKFTKILENKDVSYKRIIPIAIINASDVNSPTDLDEPNATCFIKMSDLSVEGLRQAFLDPKSRIRLNTDASPEPHTEFIAIAWEGGFLDGCNLHFNSNLNVLIGGRGTGKSTIIESLRYVLAINPLGNEANKAHHDIIKDVLKNGTKVSLLVRSHHPSKHDYTIERTVPNSPVVKNEYGEILDLLPCDVVPGIEIYSQHEISELTKNREKLTSLLERFVDCNQNSSDQKSKLLLELEASRGLINNGQQQMKLIEERLAQLPSLEETLKRFRDAGLEERLKEKSFLVHEEHILETIQTRLKPIFTKHQELTKLLPIDTAFLSDKAFETLPNSALLAEGAGVLENVTNQLQKITGNIFQVLASADSEITKLRNGWEKHKQKVEATYQALLRELQKSRIDGEEFIRLRQQIEKLRPLRDQKEQLLRNSAIHQTNRTKLLDEWQNFQSVEYRALEKAAKKVSRKLSNRVRVKVTMGGNKKPLETLLRNDVGGKLKTFIEDLQRRDDLSLLDLAQCCRDGKLALIAKYQLSPAVAERLAQSPQDTFMKIEELKLSASTIIELNISSEANIETWHTLESLSTGQKATAVLLLLLLESDSPLVVDQPEDDLDNRFITDGVVPTMKDGKRKRQFVFSTHNANIPVLGDAELILGLSIENQNEIVHGNIKDCHMGSIDMQPVREMVEEILEGGKNAFEMRRQKYGF